MHCPSKWDYCEIKIFNGLVNPPKIAIFRFSCYIGNSTLKGILNECFNWFYYILLNRTPLNPWNKIGDTIPKENFPKQNNIEMEPYLLMHKRSLSAMSSDQIAQWQRQMWNLSLFQSPLSPRMWAPLLLLPAHSPGVPGQGLVFKLVFQGDYLEQF